MSAGTGNARDTTTVSIHRDVHERLKTLRPYDSMSFNDLIDDMADSYAEESNA